MKMDLEVDLQMQGIKRITFNNGLRVLFAKGPKSRKNVVMVGFNVGSAYENDENAGLFHFLEHMLFKSTKTKKCRAIL
ncbi:MAG: insulinase family protein, partial [Candidatus Nealsonbacteria bacterium]|nr:insulinase family protein [Candidatus Nealsonbacteria bacterium]